MLAAPSAATAQSVSVNGVMGGKALLVIDGQTRMMSAGATERGVKLVSVDANEAVVEVGGKKITLAVGGSPVNLVPGEASASKGTQIVLHATSGGHFAAAGSINGRSVQFLVDTGATLVSMSQATADRIGLDYRKGRQSMAQTANGAIPVTMTTLSTVRVGDVELYNVEAIVMPAAMDTVLLGNSFLSRFQMKRDNDQMVLSKRF
ncbi:TIGR02281 family clan AA aspartic protease [soil metagenome]